MKNLLFFSQYMKEFGIKCAIVAFFSRLLPYSKKSSNVRWKILQTKHKIILSYLSERYIRQIYNEDQREIKNNNEYQQCIWTAWLQGEENAPEIVHLTIESKRRWANGHRVIVLTEKNINQYIQIPSSIKQKHADGKIGNAHYADIIRMMILAEYGGVWLDATMFLYEPVDEKAFSSPFWSIGFDSDKRSRHISNHKWIIGIMGGSKDSMYLSCVSRMLIQYWKEHDTLIDYFLFDYLIMVLYSNDQRFQLIINQLKKQNRSIYELRQIINEDYKNTIIKDLLSNNRIYNLTYRFQYNKKTDDGRMTYYGFLYDQYLGDKDKRDIE